jgi:F-type H+-transporting ATPase subunit b
MFIPKILTLIEGAGGLFDFNATLPLMAIQFILLSVVLTFVFYKPISKIVDDRNLYIKENFEAAYEKLAKADELNKEYDEKLRVANLSARAFIYESDKATKALIASEISDVGKRAIQNIQTANQDAENKRDIVLSKLSIDYGLSRAASLAGNRWVGVILTDWLTIDPGPDDLKPWFTSCNIIFNKLFNSWPKILGTSAITTNKKILDNFFSMPRQAKNNVKGYRMRWAPRF